MLGILTKKPFLNTFLKPFLNKNFASIFSRMTIKAKNEAKLAGTVYSVNAKNDKKKKKDLNLAKSRENNVQLTEEQKLKKKTYANPFEALIALRNNKSYLHTETVDITIALNIDTKRGNQVVRGIFKMPGGSNKIAKLMVFTSPAFHDLAKAAGADFVADSDTYRDIHEGKIIFDKTVCTLDTLPILNQFGRILGPKGLMPNVKIGTACTSDKLEQIIRDIKTGSREFKTDMWGQIMIPLGKREFEDKNLMTNLDAFMKAIQKAKPESIKGRFYLYAFMSCHGNSYRIDMKSLDPKSSSYFNNEKTDEKVSANI